MAHTRSRRYGWGMAALIVALAAIVTLTFLPTPYVIQRPGPVYDTLGTAQNAEGEQVPLIAAEGEEFPPDADDGSLFLTTVQVVGNRERTPSWFELAAAWLDRSRAIVPIDAVFPEGVTSEQREQQNAVLMTDSQQEATAAALHQLGYDIGAEVTVVEALEGSPAEGEIEPDDVIIAVDGEQVDAAGQVRELVQRAAGDPVDVLVRRDGAEQTVTIQPVHDEQTDAWLVGITLRTAYHFEREVHIQLDNVGGPSAGMMFALGIIDVLTEGELTGGHEIAGTGTIDAAGVVGPIGGIRQKLYGARDAGAEYFLAPAANCDEVVGHIPDGLTVIRTETLSESLAAVETIAEDGDVAALPACTAQ